MFQQSGEITKSGEAPDIHELHEHQTKTANIDSIIDWLYNLLKQIWSISSLSVLAYQRPGCGWTTLPLQASYDRMMVALSQKLPEIPMITLWPGDFLSDRSPFQHSQKKHLEPSCWSVLDHRLWMVMTHAGGVIFVLSSDVSFCGASFPPDKQKWRVSSLVSGRVMTPMAPSNTNNDGCKLGRFNGGTCIEMGLRFDFPQVSMMVLH